MSSQSLSLTGASWRPRTLDQQAKSRWINAGLHPAAATCLAGRMDLDGFADIGDDWLEPGLEHLHDPMSMLGMQAAVERLQQAISAREKVRIITDYDVDGTTSSLILQATLNICGFNQLDFHIPDRFKEGYGFSVDAAKRAAEDGVGLIVTADIGVRDHAAVDVARAHGVDVLICDHHLPAGESVPSNALVLCPPQAEDAYPNPSLAACGVSLKLAQAMLAHHPKYALILKSLLKLAAIGTVADMVSLATLENRAIVKHGLRALNEGGHTAGLKSLIDVSGLTVGSIQESDLGFRIGPRINAAGRIAHANLAVDLINSKDAVEARALARQLDELNQHRKQLQTRLTKLALEQIGTDVPPFVVVAGAEHEGWHRGVVGIVASKVKDEVHRPVAVVSIQGDHAVGSVRSVPSIHAVRALDSAADILVKYGGHPAAAGFTVPTSKLAEFKERLCAYVTSAATEEAFVPERPYDAELDAAQLDWNTYEAIRGLGPFGQGNPEPTFLLSNIDAVSPSIRASGRLLSFKVAGSPGSISASWWGHADALSVLQGGPVDVLGSLSTWTTRRGEQMLQLNVTDIRAR